MGTYLSTPVTDKCEESGESTECPGVPCAWGVVDMQGWRKSMEDAHIADLVLLEEGGALYALTPDHCQLERSESVDPSRRLYSVAAGAPVAPLAPGQRLVE